MFDKTKELNAIPYDIPGAEYSHDGEECTFDYIVKNHQLTDPAILELQILSGEQVSTVLIGFPGSWFMGQFSGAFL